MPNPILTDLIRHDWINMASATPEGFHAAFQTALATCTYWELRGAGADYTEARNKSDLLGFTALFAGSTTTRPDASQLAAPLYYYDENHGKGEIFAGLAPDGEALTGAWTDENPYGSARWSKFYRAAASGCDQFRILENKEQILIVLNKASTGERNAVFLGAIIKPLSDAGSDETDGRIKGMMTSGTWYLSQTMLNDSQAFTSSYRTENANQAVAPQAGIFLPTDKATFARIWRIGNFTIDTTAAGFKDVAGNMPLMRLAYRMHDAPYYFVGYARQMMGIMEALDNQTIRTGSGTLIGYTIAASSTSVYDAVGLTNT